MFKKKKRKKKEEIEIEIENSTPLLFCVFYFFVLYL